MEPHKIAALLLIMLFSAVNSKPRPVYNEENLEILDKRLQDSQAEVTDEYIEAIANQDYASAHGRILAVNMAHAKKRKLEMEKRMKDAANNDKNAWEKIDQVNKADGLNLYQGDIQLDEETELALGLPLRSRTKRSIHALTADEEALQEKRNAIKGRAKLWHTRVIPYLIPFYMNHIRKNLKQAINEIESKTCLRIVPYVPGKHRNYILFTNDNGCASKVGRLYHMSGAQSLSLAKGCEFVGTIIHELMHAIGFFHEQARSDRDKYVEIKWENIQKGYSNQFDKYTFKTIDQLGMDYDMDSIMHYDRKAFTKNGQPTILAIGDPNKEFGSTGTKLSPKDVIEVNKLYDCKTKYRGWTQWSAFLPCDDYGRKIRERYCYHSGNAKRQCGGKVNVYGIERDVRKCTQQEMNARNAINGHWSRWNDWGACSVTCNDGVRSRTRSCNNPAPSKYGKRCVGKRKEAAVCTVARCKLGPNDADFERGTGMWSNARSGKLRWRRHTGFTQTMNTGPMRDHTTGKGYYMYMESSRMDSARPGYQAVLHSRPLTGKAAGQCLKFYYTMYGRTLGSLRVVLKQGGKPNQQIFSIQGDQGPGWKPAMVTIDVLGSYQLTIVGRVGDIGYSDIAIDDVYIDDGVCACQDKYVSCVKWALKGDCKTDSAWMSANCPRACKTCACKDKGNHCPAWAKAGQCTINTRKYMMDKCPKSCGTCRVCEDFDEKSTNVQCPKWAKAGECQKNSRWMVEYCPASCRVCARKTRKPSCVDSSSKCRKWALKSQCTMSNSAWMLRNCRRSCNVCVCGDNNPSCAKWAKEGQCNLNTRYMHQNCKKSCRRC